MNVTNPTRVIVRGINSEWLAKNFTDFWIGFGSESGSPVSIPVHDANYVGLYLEAPESKITHIGIVEEIDRYDGGADFFLKVIIKLENPFIPDHGIRKHEYWDLSDFNLTESELSILQNIVVPIEF